MRDDEKRAVNSEARAGRTGTTMPDCCGPMLERMFKAFGDTAEEAANGESAREKGAERPRSCASMMEEMASRCCGLSPQKGTSDE